MRNRYKSYLTAGLMAINVSSFAQKPAKPNVIFIFPDQFRNYSLGYWNQGNNSEHIQGKPDPAKTPSLTKLASEGIVFSRVMSTFPLSSPYRGMLLTGKYPNQNGLTANCHKDRAIGIKADGQAMADIFGKAGYETAYFGKCHWERTEPLFDEKGTYQGTTKQSAGSTSTRSTLTFLLVNPGWALRTFSRHCATSIMIRCAIPRIPKRLKAVRMENSMSPNVFRPNWNRKLYWITWITPMDNEILTSHFSWSGRLTLPIVPGQKRVPICHSFLNIPKTGKLTFRSCSSGKMQMTRRAAMPLTILQT